MVCKEGREAGKEGKAGRKVIYSRKEGGKKERR